MAEVIPLQEGRIAWACASRPIDGQTVCGDRHVCRPFGHGVLLAVIDGAGHGQGAALAAQTAADVLEEHPADTVTDLLSRCHQALNPTRGATLSIVSLNSRDRTFTWAGVGDVEGRRVRLSGQDARADAIGLRCGVVGFLLPPLHPDTHALEPGDVIILATDGIRFDFVNSADAVSPPERIAERIIVHHFKGTDDGLVLVARYFESGGGS